VAGDLMMGIVATAKAFGQRPSSLLAIRDPVLALGFDLAATVRLDQEISRDADDGNVKKIYLD